jgi:hypothetical protein
MLGKSLITAAAGAAGAGGLTVADVFSTTLYTGNGGTQTITNDIDLSGEGGLVWLKERTSTGQNQFHFWQDTVRGAGKAIYSNSLSAQIDLSPSGITSFLSTGFTLVNGGTGVNSSSSNYVSWTFRKAEKFFDVVTYTGNGSTQNITHNLGTTPGLIVIKRTDSTSNWICWHRSLTNTTQYAVILNSTSAQFYDSFDPYPWNNTAPTSTQFSVGYYASMNQAFGVNVSGATYVAYLLAHETDSDSLIQCGGFTTGTNGVATVTLGWEPQWLMIKRTNGTQRWIVIDTQRGWDNGFNTDAGLFPNETTAELGGSEFGYPTSTGFYTTGSLSDNADYIYVAIRSASA